MIVKIFKKHFFSLRKITNIEFFTLENQKNQVLKFILHSLHLQKCFARAVKIW